MHRMRCRMCLAFEREQASAMHVQQILRSGSGHERVECFMNPVEKALPCGGDGFHPPWRRVGDVAQEPRSKPGQMTPTQLQRRIAVQQHPRHLPDDARHARWHAGCRAETCQVAERGFLAGILAVEQRDGKSFLLQVQRGARAYHSGADNGNAVASFHLLSEHECILGRRWWRPAFGFRAARPTVALPGSSYSLKETDSGISEMPLYCSMPSSIRRSLCPSLLVHSAHQFR